MTGLTADELLQFTHDLVTVARRLNRTADDQLKAIGLSQARGAALWSLSAAPDGLSQTALAERAGLEPATMVRIVDALEQQGLVERRPSPTDRRVNLVRLTAAAEPVLAQMRSIDEAVRRQLLAGTTTQEFAVATSVLQRLRDRLDAAEPVSDAA